MPEACASKARQRPSGETMPPSWKRYPRFCGKVIDTPPASAMSLWYACSEATACATATSEVEQADCTVIEGPLRSSR